jgi:tetratricopeptide (TPR) repeat protein
VIPSLIANLRSIFLYSLRLFVLRQERNLLHRIQKHIARLNSLQALLNDSLQRVDLDRELLFFYACRALQACRINEKMLPFPASQQEELVVFLNKDPKGSWKQNDTMGKKKTKKGPRLSPPSQSKADSPREYEGFYGRLREVLILFFLAFIAFSIYSNTLGTPFIFDDVVNIQNNTHIRLTSLTLGGITEAGFESGSKQRPVPYITFALNYYFHRYAVGGYHVVNILIHIITGIFLYFLVRATLNLPTLRSKYETYKWLPFLTTLIWIVHPLHTQSVTYIVQRMNSMAAMFYVLSLFLYVKARMTDEKRKKWTLFSACILSGLLALGSKENAATLPFFIVLYEWYFFQDLSKDWLRRNLKYFLGVVALIGLIAFMYLGMSPWGEVIDQRDFLNNEFTYTERVLTQFRVVIHYMSLIILPHPSRLNLDYDFPLSHSLTDPITTLLSMAAIAGLIALGIYLAKKERLLSFCILWFLGNLVIESTFIPLAVIFEHRTYLPSMFVSLLAVSLGFRYIKPQRAKAAALCVAIVVIMVYAVWTYQRNSTWSDKVTLWGDCVVKSPKKPRSRLNLAMALESQGRLDEAMSQYHEALRINPDFWVAHYDLARALFRQQRFEEAISHYYEALRINPDFADTHYNLGEALMLQERFEEAIRHYRKALEIKPDFAKAHNNLGIALEKQGRPREAIDHYLEALRIKPDLAEAHYNMGNVLMRQGRTEEAIRYYYKTLRANPDYLGAHYNLGVALAMGGDRKGAAFHFSEVLRLDPDNFRARQALELLSQ